MTHHTFFVHKAQHCPAPGKQYAVANRRRLKSSLICLSSQVRCCSPYTPAAVSSCQALSASSKLGSSGGLVLPSQPRLPRLPRRARRRPASMHPTLAAAAERQRCCCVCCCLLLALPLAAAALLEAGAVWPRACRPAAVADAGNDCECLCQLIALRTPPEALRPAAQEDLLSMAASASDSLHQAGLLPPLLVRSWLLGLGLWAGL